MQSLTLFNYKRIKNIFNNTFYVTNIITYPIFHQ